MWCISLSIDKCEFCDFLLVCHCVPFWLRSTLTLEPRAAGRRHRGPAAAMRRRDITSWWSARRAAPAPRARLRRTRAGGRVGTCAARRGAMSRCTRGGRRGRTARAHRSSAARWRTCRRSTRGPTPGARRPPASAATRMRAHISYPRQQRAASKTTRFAISTADSAESGARGSGSRASCDTSRLAR